jgi:hypothetical protein
MIPSQSTRKFNSPLQKGYCVNPLRTPQEFFQYYIFDFWVNFL